MRRIFVAVAGMLVLAGAFRNIVHLVPAVVTAIVATQGIGSLRTCGRILGFAYLAVAIAGFVGPDLFGMMHVTVGDNVLSFAVAVAFLYVGLVAPPKL